MTPPSMTANDIEQAAKELKALGVPEQDVLQELNARQKQQQVIELLTPCLPVFTWFTEITDLFRFSESVCVGLDVTAVKHDAELAQRQVHPNSYQLLRSMGRAVTRALNERLESSLSHE